MSEKPQKEYDTQRTPFSWDKLDGILARPATLVICAEILGVHENTIKLHIKDRFGETFTEYSNRKMSITKFKLMDKALKMAESGNVPMLIFSLKNLCGWSDKIESKLDIDTTKIEIKILEEEVGI